ncbi:histidine phosphatase family protein [Halopseudomonas sp.]|mgnify:CR=1 FL=1|uniref:lipopolysaccharide core heptose(II)-phosphate phosphatase PmrG n=1 Tax=Halopseudomonas sp. TaxID=2901191 RepID=UPI0030010920
MKLKRLLRSVGRALPFIAAIALAAWVLDPPELPDLSAESGGAHKRVLQSWQLGEIVVLVRHLERCDRSDSPCLDGRDGITARSVDIGKALSEDFYQLGLDQAMLYNSPMTRTDQTADILFGDYSGDRNWLKECRKSDSLLRDVMRFKQPGRNLVLITHSTCIARFEEALGFSSDTPDYGTSIFLVAQTDVDHPRVKGFLDVEDWDRVFEADVLPVPSLLR